tara:strand:- start:422 stop:1228 length:807 start_codon:yes stop_codon:yes gene_type:complete
MAKLHGVEPSRNAHKFFQKVLPHVTLSESTYEDSPFINETFDLITSNGVLEHVPDPVAFLKNIRNSLKDDGYLYIGVPNFENNPADLFTFDHLTRFTPSTLDSTFKLAGFKIVSSKIFDKRVPMWFMVQKSNQFSLDKLTINIDEQKILIAKTLRELKAFFDSYEIASQRIAQTKNKIALYGTGGFGLIATEYTQMHTDLIACILDDNASMWGSKRLGINVIDPKKLAEHENVTEIVISANPCYVPLIAQKALDLFKDKKINIHVPKI